MEEFSALISELEKMSDAKLMVAVVWMHKNSIQEITGFITDICSKDNNFFIEIEHSKIRLAEIIHIKATFPNNFY